MASFLLTGMHQACIHVDLIKGMQMGWRWLVQNSPLIAGIIGCPIMPQYSPQKVEEACVSLQAANCNGSLPAWPCKPLHTIVLAAGI